MSAISSRLWIPFTLALAIAACSSPQRAQVAAPNPESLPEILIPLEGTDGWHLRMEAVLGDERNAPISFDLRIAGDLWAMVFPANGILPGMQLRAAPGSLTLLDPATSRCARLRGRFEPLSEPSLRSVRFSRQMHRLPDGSWSIRYFGRLPDGLSSTHELVLVPGASDSFPPVRDVAAFLMRRPPMDLPPQILDMPISRWEWRENFQRKTGFSRFSILQAHETRILQEDLASSIAGYALHDPPDLLPKAAVDARSPRPLVTSGERSGLLFVNRMPHGLLVPGQLTAPGVLVAEIQLIPLLGGLPIWEGTVRGPHVWTISP